MNDLVWRSIARTRLVERGTRLSCGARRLRAACRGVWAHELHRIDGKLDIYVAASVGRMNACMSSEGVDDSPTGEFRFKAEFLHGRYVQTQPAQHRWAIDGTILDFLGRRYFIWSGWGGRARASSTLHRGEGESVARRANRVRLCANNVHAWTPRRDRATRGLTMRRRCCSATAACSSCFFGEASWETSYKLGLLELAPSGDPLNRGMAQDPSRRLFRRRRARGGRGTTASFARPTARRNGSCFTRNSRRAELEARDSVQRSAGTRTDGPISASQIDAGIAICGASGDVADGIRRIRASTAPSVAPRWRGDGDVPMVRGVKIVVTAEYIGERRGYPLDSGTGSSGRLSSRSLGLPARSLSIRSLAAAWRAGLLPLVESRKRCSR